ncbi:helix-turn-helix transcriptional regulator [Amycolatopsis sp. NPDC004625]|uniref:helix-turn-helix domain-containing protein n=1 Tax=Amycolatopsis sp. NPDC004625 TaxID=3154670 RepID=UPI0033AE555F
MAIPGVHSESAQVLGARIREARMARGLSLRAVARQVGLAGHGTLVDYEHGRRIPPDDLVAALERVLGIDDGSLRDLRARALAERAARASTALLAPRAPAERPRPRRRLLAVSGVVVALAAIAIGWPASRPAPAARMGFETDAVRWWILYGAQVAHVETTSSLAAEGEHSLLVTVTGASAAKGYSAVGISHDVGSIRPGTQVHAAIWVPGPERGGISFLVHDSRGKNHWSVENQSAGDQQTETPLPDHAGWAPFSWTVPEVDRVTTIGIQFWSESDQPLLVGIDAVTW